MYENFSNICTIDKETIDNVFVLVPVQKGVFRQITLKSLIEDSIVVDKNTEFSKDDISANKVETVYPKVETVHVPAETLSINADTSADVNQSLHDSPSIEDQAIEYLEHKSRGRKSKLDYGKLEALKKAGWSVKEISLELKCTPAAIYNYLKKHPIN